MHPELFYKKSFLIFYVFDNDIGDLQKVVVYLLRIPIPLP